MKTFKKIFGIIAIGAVIMVGVNACKSAAERYDAAIKTPEGLALKESMEKATWKAKALSSAPNFGDFDGMPLGNDRFANSAQIIKHGFFSNTLGTRSGDPKLNDKTWYELTSSNFPGITYLYYKDENKGEKGFFAYEADDQRSAYKKVLNSGKWQVKKLDKQPSLTGFTKISKQIYKADEWTLQMEVNYIDSLIALDYDPDVTNINIWHEITAPEFPSVTYYHNYQKQSKGAISTSAKDVYKRKQ